jgi:kynurenine formamidase
LATKAKPVTEEEILSYFARLSNWGRWGPDDQAGTLNLISPQVTAVASGLIKHGVSVGCARPLGAKPAKGLATNQYIHLMTGSGEAVSHDGAASAGDWIAIGFHGFEFTHLDAHSHFFWKGQMYNGRPASACTSDRGALSGGIEPWFNGISGRGILVDGPELRGKPWLDPGEGLRPDELSTWYDSHGLRPAPGDLLFVRTGRDAWEQAGADVPVSVSSSPGLDGSCLPWLHDHGVAVLLGDGSNDALPSGYPTIGNFGPIHAVGLVAMGLWLVDNAELGALFRRCQQLDRYEFFATIAPLTLRRATGSPVTPVAMF